MNETMNRWTVGQVAINKFFMVIIMTVISTKYGTNLVNKLMSPSVVMDNGFIHTQHFFLPKVGQLILGVLIFLLLVICAKFILNLTSHKSKPVEQRKEFTWYSLYSLVLGVYILHWTSELTFFLIDSSYMFIVNFSVTIILTFLIHMGMLAVTKTNQRLISEIEQGEYEGHFADELYAMEPYDKVITLLRRGHVSTVWAAMIFLKIRGFFIGILEVFFSIFFKIFRGIFGESSHYSPRRLSTTDYDTYDLSYDTSEEDNRMAREQAIREEREAENQARQEKMAAEERARELQRQADISAKRYAEQTAYNARYNTNEKNRYIHDQGAANQAKRDARRL